MTFVGSWLILVALLVSISHTPFVDGATTVSIIHPVEDRIAEASDVILQCSITEYDSTTESRDLAWTKNGELFAYNDELRGEFTGLSVTISNFTSAGTTFYTMIFLMTTFDDGGNYKCLVVEGSPSSYREVVSDSKTLSVVQPYHPICSPSVGDRYLVENSQVTISCKVETLIPYDYPHIYWRRAGVLLSESVQIDDEYERISQLHLNASQNNLEHSYIRMCYSYNYRAIMYNWSIPRCSWNTYNISKVSDST